MAENSLYWKEVKMFQIIVIKTQILQVHFLGNITINGALLGWNKHKSNARQTQKALTSATLSYSHFCWSPTEATLTWAPSCPEKKAYPCVCVKFIDFLFARNVGFCRFLLLNWRAFPKLLKGPLLSADTSCLWLARKVITLIIALVSWISVSADAIAAIMNVVLYGQGSFLCMFLKGRESILSSLIIQTIQKI